jgi:heavy metal sensor kinase
LNQRLKVMGRLPKVTSVRVRLTLWNMAALALALIGCAFIVHAAVRTFLIASVDQDLRDEAAAAYVRMPSPNTVHDQHSVFYRRQMSLPPGRQRSNHTFKVVESGPIAIKAQNPMAAWMMPKSGIEVDQSATKPPRDVEFRQFPQAGDYASGSVGPNAVAIKPPPDAVPYLPEPPNALYSRFSELHRFVVMRLLDSKGRMLPQRSQPASEEVPMLDRQLALAGRRERIATLTANRQEWRVLTRPLTVGGEVKGSVQVAYPLQGLHSLLRGLDRTLLILIPVALFITSLGGAFLTDRAIRPVRRIARAVSEMEGADLSRRLPVTGGDEFAELATTFNSMFGRLEVAFSRLATAVEQQRRFTADASHELRTPLTTIKTNADWALRKRRRVAEYQEALGAIAEAASRTNHLIEDLLSLARSDHERPAFDPNPVPITQVITRAVSALSKQAVQAPVNLDLPDTPVYVRGDADRFERLVINLVENALRHTPPEGHICVSARSRGEKVVLTVEDTGEGIPPEHLPFVCDRFYRVDAARSRPAGGAGLGLSICRSIAQAHGGTLEIRSLPGAGTTVTVTLPQV